MDCFLHLGIGEFTVSVSTYRLPDGLGKDLEEVRLRSAEFRQGTLSPARFQAFRVPQGVYEQRESGAFMLRARLAAGILTPPQMRAAADVSERWGNGTLHLTSRQDLQIHGVSAEGIHPALVQLAAVGLSTKGGGGNTVRNIATCPLAGVCPKEAFDVTSQVVRLTETMLNNPLSFQMPRKYKIAFSGCGEDCAAATVNDLGFIAKRRGSVEGFSVWVAGGMGVHSCTSQLLEEFVPAGDALRIAEAIQRVFDRHGNRKNRHHARLRFLVQDLGFERFRELYRAELGSPIAPVAGSNAPTPGGEIELSPGVLAQRQPGLLTVEIGREIGTISAGRLRALAGVIERYGEGVLRITSWQRPLLRNVRVGDLEALLGELAALGIEQGEPLVLRRLTVCAGAATCRLGICQSRGLGTDLRRTLLAGGVDLQGKAGRVSIHISGCPNCCGRHPVASIGLFGAARHIDGRVVPFYVVQLGGRVREGSTQLASGRIAVPARRAAAYLHALLHAYEVSAATSFDTFLIGGGRELAAEIARRYAAVPPFAEDPSFYTDLGATEPFSLAGRGVAECGAGIFDLIQLDIVAASEALAAGRLREATVHAARALLVTRGQQAENDVDALGLFERYFIAAGSVAPELATTLAAARDGEPEASGVAQLLTEVKRLYGELGPTLKAV